MMVFICCILAVAVLKILAVVFVPLTIALLLAFVMYPLVRLLDNYRFPRLISIILIVIIIVAGMCTFGMVIFSSGSNILSLYPKYEYRLSEIYVWIARLLQLPYDESLSFWENLWGQLGIRTWVRNFAFSFSNIFINFMSTAVLVLMFLVFILLEASNIKGKLEAAFETRAERVKDMSYDLMSQVSRYLTAKFLISLVNGIIFAVAFRLIGLEFAILWGIIQFLMNFIPTLGSIATGATISLFALVQFWPDPVPIILIVIVVLGVNLILGNILDPKIIGEQVGISPLIVLASLVLWGFIWGFAGMVLAVPMTSIIKILCENVSMLEPVSILMGTKKGARKKAKQKKAKL